MKKFIVIFASGVVIATIVAALTAIPVYYLWNALMPDLFGLHSVTLLQALGLSLLGNTLFNVGGKSISHK